MSLETDLLAIFEEPVGKTAAMAAEQMAAAIESGSGGIPIGSIIAWHKSLTGVPVLAPAFVECNGQTLDDEESPLYGQVIPDLNSTGRFLRGSATSGTMQDDAFQGHRHTQIGGSNTGGSSDSAIVSSDVGTRTATSTTGSPVTDGTNGTPRTDSETRPINMSVVWIMRVK